MRGELVNVLQTSHQRWIVWTMAGNLRNRLPQSSSHCRSVQRDQRLHCYRLSAVS